MSFIADIAQQTFLRVLAKAICDDQVTTLPPVVFKVKYIYPLCHCSMRNYILRWILRHSYVLLTHIFIPGPVRPIRS